MKNFIYHPEILSSFSDLRAGIILAEKLSNDLSVDQLLRKYSDQQDTTIAEISDKPISELEAIAAWRNAFRKFGV
ncbi:MAG: hypothetical protein ACK2U3_17005, partial [Anaerolineales bacterium]